MRSDRTRSDDFVNAPAWSDQTYQYKLFEPLKNGPPFYKANSFSGNEPNHLFLNDGIRFHNLTQVSGADQTNDGRSFVYFDFDKDGWLDIALANTNNPRFQLFRNQLSQVCANRRLQIRLIGGSANAQPTANESNRDAIGARILVEFESGRKAMTQKQVGQGNVAQNSELIWVGFEQPDPPIKLTVHWPSKKTTTVKDFDLTKTVEIKESQPAVQKN